MKTKQFKHYLKRFVIGVLLPKTNKFSYDEKMSWLPDHDEKYNEIEL